MLQISWHLTTFTNLISQFGDRYPSVREQIQYLWSSQGACIIPTLVMCNIDDMNLYYTILFK